MKYKKGTFVLTPNIDILNGKPALMQSIFTWLCKYSDEEGICFPSRNKLAKNVDCDVRTIDKYIKSLEEIGLITKTKRRKSGTKENTSNLYQIQLVGEEMYPPSEFKYTTPSEPNDTVTITNINSNHLTTLPKEISKQKEEKIVLSNKPGTNPVGRLQTLYSFLFKHLYGFKPSTATYGMNGAIFKSLLSSYSEIQIGSLLCVFFAWQGMDDKNEKDKEWLVNNTHSLRIFRGDITKYETYIRNVAGWSKEFEDDEALLRIVQEKMRDLSTT